MKMWRRLFLIAAICCLSTNAYAVDNEENPELMFTGDYVEGVVIKEPWQGDFTRIKIDQVTFILAEDIRYYRRTKNPAGAFEEEPITISDIHQGDNVEVKAHGNRISQFVVVEQGEGL